MEPNNTAFYCMKLSSAQFKEFKDYRGICLVILIFECMQVFNGDCNLSFNLYGYAIMLFT